jgi:superfamily II DNA/RNA helicase
VYGGTPYDRQIKRLRAGVDLVIATPGRLDDLVRRGACLLDDVQVLVLDEADHLCDLGFYPVVSGLVSKTPATGQPMLLSATLDGIVDRLVWAHLKNPVLHDCALDEVAPDLTHHVLVTGTGNKIDSAARLLRANPRSIVFTRTRRGATRLATDLAARGITTVGLRQPRARMPASATCASSTVRRMSVATDVAARGIMSTASVCRTMTRREQGVRLRRPRPRPEPGAVVTMATHPQVSEIGRLHRAAGVTARHHDVSSAPEPMTSDTGRAGTVVTPGSLPSARRRVARVVRQVGPGSAQWQPLSRPYTAQARPAARTANRAASRHAGPVPRADAATR